MFSIRTRPNIGEALRKPRVLDYSNPINQGLVDAYIFGSKNGSSVPGGTAPPYKSLLNNSHSATVSSNSYMTEDGLRYDGGLSAPSITNLGDVSSSQRRTVLVRFRINTLAGASFPNRGWVFNFNVGGSDPAIYTLFTDTAYVGGLQDGTSSFYEHSFTANVSKGWHVAGYCLDCVSDVMDLFFDGVFNTFTETHTPKTGVSNTVLASLNSTGGSEDGKITISHLYIFNRRLSFKEYMACYQDISYPQKPAPKPYVGIAGAITANLGFATETDSALALTIRKLINLGLSTETGSTFSLSARKDIPLGIITETNIAFPITVAKQVALQYASELNTAFTIAVTKIVNLGIATESDIAFAILTGEVTKLCMTLSAIAPAMSLSMSQIASAINLEPTIAQILGLSVTVDEVC